MSDDSHLDRAKSLLDNAKRTLDFAMKMKLDNPRILDETLDATSKTMGIAQAHAMVSIAESLEVLLGTLTTLVEREMDRDE